MSSRFEVRLLVARSSFRLAYNIYVYECLLRIFPYIHASLPSYASQPYNLQFIDFQYITITLAVLNGNIHLPSHIDTFFRSGAHISEFYLRISITNVLAKSVPLL